MASTARANIPTEILELIFSHFCIHCRGESDSPGPEQDPDEPSWYSLGRHTLFSLCLASRQFYEVAQPILYHEFVLGYGRSWRSKLYSWDGRLMSFLRTVKERRDLAALVKWVFIPPNLLQPIFDDETADVPPRPRRAYELARTRALRRIDNSVDILLSQLPNLERYSVRRNLLLSATRSSPVPGAAGVSRLPIKTIDVSLNGGADARYCLDIGRDHIINISRHLTTINIHMCGGIRADPRFNPLPSLMTLRITHSRLTADDLQQLLSSFTGLQTFVYEATGPPSSFLQCTIDFGLNHFDASDAVKYLSRHRSALKSLHLDLRSRLLMPFNPNDHFQSTVSFRDFAVLEHLFINLSELYDLSHKESSADFQLLVNLLPRGIKSLHLAGDICGSRSRLAIGLYCLAIAASKGRFPRLEEVRCDAQSRIDDEYGLSAMFTAAGVDFGYHSWPHSEPTLKESDMPPRSGASTSLPSDDDSDL